jgi:predicted HTH domain antitoxin
MAIVLSDELLRATGMSEAEAKLEIACRLFDAGKLTVGHAAKFADVSEAAFEDALRQRKIPRYRYTEDMLNQDIATLKKLGRW